MTWLLWLAAWSSWSLVWKEKVRRRKQQRSYTMSRSSDSMYLGMVLIFVYRSGFFSLFLSLYFFFFLCHSSFLILPITHILTTKALWPPWSKFKLVFRCSVARQHLKGYLSPAARDETKDNWRSAKVIITMAGDCWASSMVLFDYNSLLPHNSLICHLASLTGQWPNGSRARIW